MAEKARQLLGAAVIGGIGVIILAGAAWVVSRIVRSMLGVC